MYGFFLSSSSEKKRSVVINSGSLSPSAFIPSFKGV